MSDEVPLLSVRNLKKHYPITKGLMKRQVGTVRAVDGINFEVRRGETIGIVGESGCGKSTAATSVLHLEQPTDGEIRFDGTPIDEYEKADMKRFRRRAQMIFQDPDSSFDPRMSVGESVAEPLYIHGMRDRQKRRDIAKNLLERVGLSAEDIDRYPHEFSGGQKQRIALARALVTNPDLIVADEPVSALDVSIQAEILALMDELQTEFGLGIVLISHNMGVIQQVCDRVAVMYLGEIVELGDTEDVFADPQHPYTRALLSSIPTPNPRNRGQGIELTGDVPDPSNPPTGCRFHTRCPEIIQPEGYDFKQTNWRRVMDLRIRLRDDGVDLDTVREFVVTEGRANTAEDVTDEQVKRAVRDEFDLPDTLSDPQADSVLSDALDAIAAGDDATARDLLADEFATVCVADSPSLKETDTRHESSCHLRDGVQESTQPVQADD